MRLSDGRAVNVTPLDYERFVSSQYVWRALARTSCVLCGCAVTAPAPDANAIDGIKYPLQLIITP